VESSRPFRVYIGGSSHPDEMARVKRWNTACREAGIEVTSTWLDVVAGTSGGANPREATVDDRRGWSAQDLSEVARADALWFLVPPVERPTRGAWAELGYAYARAQLILISGDTKQSIFPALGAEFDSDEEAFRTLLLVKQRAGR
jgi:nucleoside 2-deoxyribosyltransferase